MSNSLRPLQIINLWADVMENHPFPCKDNLSARETIVRMNPQDKETFVRSLMDTKELDKTRYRSNGKPRQKLG